MHQPSSIPEPVFWPVIRFAFIYPGLRYGIDLRLAWPVDAIRATKVPILSIHGALDGNIPPRHSPELHAASRATSHLL